MKKALVYGRVATRAQLSDQRITKQTVEHLRTIYPKGTRVELVSMDDPYRHIEPGLKAASTKSCSSSGCPRKPLTCASNAIISVSISCTFRGLLSSKVHRAGHDDHISPCHLVQHILHAVLQHADAAFHSSSRVRLLWLSALRACGLIPRPGRARAPVFPIFDAVRQFITLSAVRSFLRFAPNRS